MKKKQHTICPETNSRCPYGETLIDGKCKKSSDCVIIEKTYVQKQRLFLAGVIAIIIFCLALLIILMASLFGNNGTETNDTTTMAIAITTTSTSINSVINTTTQVKTSKVTTIPQTTLAIIGEPTKPIKIQISSINLDASIQGVAKDDFNNINILDSQSIVSWYKDSAMNSISGNSILLGNKYKGGIASIFYSLDSIKEGDTITITMDNNEIITQEVYYVHILPKENFTSDILSLDDSIHRLTIISETGVFDENTNSFSDYIIIYAR